MQHLLVLLGCICFQSELCKWKKPCGPISRILLYVFYCRISWQKLQARLSLSQRHPLIKATTLMRPIVPFMHLPLQTLASQDKLGAMVPSTATMVTKEDAHRKLWRGYRVNNPLYYYYYYYTFFSVKARIVLEEKLSTLNWHVSMF